MTNTDRHQVYKDRTRQRQASYAAKNRKKRKEVRRPDARDVGAAILDLTLELTIVNPRPGPRMAVVAKHLVDAGFDDAEVRDVLDGLLDRHAMSHGR